MPRDSRRFGRGGCFVCRLCGKRTRCTGENGSVQLCPLCDVKSLNGNSLSDAGFKGDAWSVFDACTTALECDELLTALLDNLHA